jgi:hypothetical protein
LDIEIPAKLQCGDALDGVDEDRDRREVIPMRQLAGMKHRAGGHAELPMAALAAPDWAAVEAVYFEATAVRAVKLAIVVRPADGDKPRMRFLVTHAQH